LENERLNGLLAYLNGLTKLANSDVSYLCTKEIAECITELKAELEIGVSPRKPPSYKSLVVQTAELSGGFREYELSDVPTAQLSKELAKREGVCEYVLGPHGSRVEIKVDTGEQGFTKTIEGPARIIVN